MIPKTSFRDAIPDYDIKMREADRIVRENAGEVLNIYDFLPIARDEKEAELIVRALRERNDGYIFIVEDERRWYYPFNIKVARAMAEVMR